MRKTKDTQDELYRLFTNNVDDWEFDTFYARHKKTGIKYWTSNGLFFFSVDQCKKPNLGFFNWVSLYFWLKNAKNQQIINTINSI